MIDLLQFELFASVEKFSVAGNRTSMLSIVSCVTESANSRLASHLRKAFVLKCYCLQEALFD